MEERLGRVGVGKGRVAQGHEQLVLLARADLARGKGDVQQVLAQRAGQGAAEDRQEFLGLFLLHERERLVEDGQHLAALVDVAPAHVRDAVFLRAEPAAQLRDLFIVHGIYLSKLFLPRRGGNLCAL